MLYKIIALAYVAIASAGSVELVSGDLGKSGVGLDNIKGKVSQAVKMFGRDTTLEVSCALQRGSNSCTSPIPDMFVHPRRNRRPQRERRHVQRGVRER